MSVLIVTQCDKCGAASPPQSADDFPDLPNVPVRDGWERVRTDDGKIDLCPGCRVDQRRSFARWLAERQAARRAAS